MAKTTRSFILGRMNKSVSPQLIKNGEYEDALNIRINSSNDNDDGLAENPLGNIKITSIEFDGTPLSADATAIGVFADDTEETIYWMIHDPSFNLGDTGKLDMIVSFNESKQLLRYHVVSIDDGSGINTTLNFNPSYRINQINKIFDLLFFTDNYNQPRRIDITKTYAVPTSPGYIDDAILSEDILVIKKPPIYPPSINLIQNATANDDDKYLSDKMLSFAYRYRYQNGEYSAISPFTNPAFLPNPFELSDDTFLNKGMENLSSLVVISYNTGSKLVTDVELLFKEYGTSVIQVIERINKEDYGLIDNDEVDYEFSERKIFTILPESEILRLYDSVPYKAKAQTIMGNRLVYGQYSDGNDLIDLNGKPVYMKYKASLKTNTIYDTEIPWDLVSGTYVGAGLESVGDSVLELDFNGVDLTAGRTILFSLNFSHAKFANGTVTPLAPSADFQISFTFTLMNSYQNVYDLANSDEFKAAIGTELNIQQDILDACDGETLTDIFNCQVSEQLQYNSTDSVTKDVSGISSFIANQPFKITATASGLIYLHVPAIKFVDLITPTNYTYEYFEFSDVSVRFVDSFSFPSLHSNRDYEVSIIYEDEFGRQSLPQVSKDNSIHIPCSNSVNQNYIQIEIPPSQVAPEWASFYKFAIKADRDTYETIFTNIFFKDPDSGYLYCLLEGENSRKIEEGDSIIVKRDTDGATSNCIETIVIEKKAQEEDFITIDGMYIPSGVYMKLNANNFAANYNSDIILDGEEKVSYYDASLIGYAGYGYYASISYPVNVESTTTQGEYVDVPITAGTQIRLYFKISRRGSLFGCEKRIYILDETLTVKNNYDNFYDWWIGDDVKSILNSGYQDIGDGACEYDNVFFPALATQVSDFTWTPNICTNYYQFLRDSTTNKLSLYISGTKTCSGMYHYDERQATITVRITATPASNLLVFETKPQETLPDVFYLGEQVFRVGDGGAHLGNVQNQDFTTGDSAIIDTTFMNCFSFGNGVESYKVNDSVRGAYFGLGHQVVATSSREYKRVNRYADFTWSGIYNDESNVNKLNEFNEGLLNYKRLEQSFGGIEILDGRETDILVLQEDRISYVLAGKNLLSDAAAGGSITSIPEVFGTQIARIEEHGISANPESFAKFGAIKYFTDLKRNAVIQLIGNSGSSEKLAVISSLGMTGFFRSFFEGNNNTQKLGGYDPFNNEYVLSDNGVPIMGDSECFDCGQSYNILVEEGGSEEVCVDLSDSTKRQSYPGLVEIDYALLSAEGTFIVRAIYDGGSVSSGEVTESGTISFSKTSSMGSIITVVVEAVSGDVSLAVSVHCPETVTLSVIQITLTSNYSEIKKRTIHNSYGYIDGLVYSPEVVSFIEFATGTTLPLVSKFISTSGAQGSPIAPTQGSSVIMRSSKRQGDTFEFDPAVHKFRYLRTNTIYPKDASGYGQLINDASVGTIFGSGSEFFTQFSLPASGDYLYMIWDYRDISSISLCESDAGMSDACCNCR